MLNFLHCSGSSEAIHQLISRRKLRHSEGLPFHVGTLYHDEVPLSSPSGMVGQNGQNNKGNWLLQREELQKQSKGVPRQWTLQKTKVEVRLKGQELVQKGAKSQKWRRGDLRCKAVLKRTSKVGPAGAKDVEEVESAEANYRKDRDDPNGEDVAKRKGRCRSAASGVRRPGRHSGSGATVERWTHRSPNKQRSRFTCDVVEWLRP